MTGESKAERVGIQAVNPALGRSRQVDLSEFENNLVYSGSSRDARVIW